MTLQDSRGLFGQVERRGRRRHGGERHFGNRLLGHGGVKRRGLGQRGLGQRGVRRRYADAAGHRHVRQLDLGTRTAARLLGLPPDRRCDFLLSFGYPEDPAKLTAPNRAGGRVSLEELVHQERW